MFLNLMNKCLCLATIDHRCETCLEVKIKELSIIFVLSCIVLCDLQFQCC